MGSAAVELSVGWGLELMALRGLAKDFEMFERAEQVLKGRRRTESQARAVQVVVLLSSDERD